MTRIVKLNDLTVGVRIARDVLSGHAATAPLLRAGVTVTEGYLAALRRSGIGGVVIDDELGSGIETTSALSAGTRLEVTNALAGAFAEAPAAIAAGHPLTRSTLSSIESAVDSLINDIGKADTATLALASLAAADAYTLEHSIDVTVLGLLIASELFRTRGRLDHRGERTHAGLEAALRRLGIGLLLHDIGKVAMPPEILQKPGPLDDAEFALVREHPLIGIGLLDITQVSSHAIAVVRSHHERWDGRGYPEGLVGAQIPEFARIAAVADVYSAMTTRRPYREPEPAVEVLALLRRGAGTEFDSEVVEAMCAVVAPYPPGSEITLADGCSGVVVSVPRTRLDRPLVRVVRDAAGAAMAPREVDLQAEPALVPTALRA